MSAQLCVLPLPTSCILNGPRKPFQQQPSTAYGVLDSAFVRESCQPQAFPSRELHVSPFTLPEGQRSKRFDNQTKKKVRVRVSCLTKFGTEEQCEDLASDGRAEVAQTHVVRPSIACSPMASCVFQREKSRLVPLGREEELLPVSQTLFSPKCGSRRFPVVQSTLPLDRSLLCFSHS